MKTFARRLLSLVVAVVVLPVFASAASDMHLKLGGVKGEARIVPCPSGVCVIDGLAPGSYTVQVCDANGVVIPSDVELACAVKSPRDAASGQATGKRQHQPSIRISKQASATPTNVLTVAEAGTQVTLTVTTAATAPAQDHNSTRSNKSS